MPAADRFLPVVANEQKSRHPLSRSVPLPDEPGYDARRGVLLIQRMTELLSGRLVLLLDCESLEEDGVVLVLKRVQQRRYRRGGWWAWRGRFWI